MSMDLHGYATFRDFLTRAVLRKAKGQGQGHQTAGLKTIFSKGGQFDMRVEAIVTFLTPWSGQSVQWEFNATVGTLQRVNLRRQVGTATD